MLLYGTEKKVGVRDFDRVSLLLPLEPPEARSVLRLEEMRRGLAGEGEEVAEEDDFDKTFGSAEEGQVGRKKCRCGTFLGRKKLP